MENPIVYIHLAKNYEENSFMFQAQSYKENFR